MEISHLKIAAHFNECQKRIKRAFGTYIARKNRSKGKQLVRISTDKVSNLETTNLIGNFTNPPWAVKIPLAYSLSHKEYFIEIWLSVGNQFRLLRNQKTFVISNFPQITDNVSALNNGQLSNIFLYRKPFSRRNICSRYKTLTLKLNAGAYSEGKTQIKNEDSYFVASNCMGVADGVGGWNNYGVSSKDFANELMQNCKEIVEKSTKTPSLKKTAENAFYQVKSGGSAAWIMANLDQDKLKVTNLGDCGLAVIREINGHSKLIFQTTPQEHSFNTPYQMSLALSKSQTDILKVKLSPKRFEEVTEQMKNVIKDSCSDADDYFLKVRSGDIIIMATDGLWDNVFPKEILTLLATCKANLNDPSELANLLGKYAYSKSKSKLNTPFEEKVKKIYGKS